MYRSAAILLIPIIGAGCSGEGSVSTAAEAIGADLAESAESGVRPAEAPGAHAFHVYNCEQRAPITARFSDEGVHLDLTTDEVFLPQTVSASGSRYAAGDRVFWSKGHEATFETPQSVRQCIGTPADTPWEAARLRGATLRALGQEPGWVVEVVPERWMHYRGDYGAQNVLAADVATHEVDSAVEYRADTAGHRLVLRVTETPCIDVMSGESFELTATVEIDDRELQGCGRAL